MLTSGNGRHRKPRPAPAAVTAVATAAAAGAGIALPLMGATAAHAAGDSTWDRVAACETGGMWSANTGNGFFGGLAITQTTWDEYGGDAYAARPDLASRAQQITVAEKVLAVLGPDAWPGCQRGTGLLTDTSTPRVDPGAPSASPTLPGLPLPSLPQVPPPAAHGAPLHGPHATPGAPASAQPSGTPGGPASTSPASPVAPTVSGSPSGTASATGAPTDGASAAPSTPATPGAGTPSTGAPGRTNTPGTPGLPDVLTPPGASATTPGGRHAKPYAPTDEQLAAADRATRTEVYGITGRDATGAPLSGDDSSADSGNNGKKTGTSPVKDDGRYTVDAGDSLSGIAASRHVDGGWPALYDANRQVIGGNPNLIKPGQILNLR